VGLIALILSAGEQLAVSRERTTSETWRQQHQSLLAKCAAVLLMAAWLKGAGSWTEDALNCTFSCSSPDLFAMTTQFL